MKRKTTVKSISLLRFFRGYVTFKAYGGFPDRFLNSARRMGVNMFNMRHVDGNIIAECYIPDYRNMHLIRKDSQMRVHIIKRAGIPFILYKRRNRKGLLVGMLLFLLITQILSSYVWMLDVEGCETIDKNDIRQIYAENGISIGTYMKKVDVKKVEENVVEGTEGLIWTAFNQNGGRGVIKVREGKEVPTLKAGTPPRNVVAKYDGRIVTYEVYEGTAEQQLYAAVTKGDLLISGVLTFMDGSVTLRPADGNVEAETKREIKTVVDKNFQLARVSSTKTMNKIHFFSKIRNEGASSYRECIVLNGVMLPIGRTKTKKIFLDKLTKADFFTKSSKKRLLSIGLDDFFMAEDVGIDEKNIVKKSITIGSDDDKVTFLGKYDLVENICDYSELQISEEQ